MARETSKELPLFIVLLNTKENDDERTTYPRDTAQNAAVSQIMNNYYTLGNALTETLRGVSVSYEDTTPKQEERDAVEAFITAKRIEGCSEKTLKYYRKTIESMLSAIGKKASQVTTEDLRKYLTTYQTQRKSSKVTIDNIRRILSSLLFFGLRMKISS